MKFFIALSCLICALIYHVEAKGYPNFLCQVDGEVTQPGMLAPCAQDCMNLHGSVGGKCGKVNEKDYNCYCEKERHYLITQPELALHCQSGKNDTNFQAVCEMDCKCSHAADAATGGTCDFKTRQCVCNNQGANVNNVGCTSKTAKEFGIYVKETLGADLGHYGTLYVRCVLENDGKDCANWIAQHWGDQ